MARAQLVCWLALVLATAARCEDGATVVARTRQGRVRGRLMTSFGGRPFVGFYKLPYARPPVGPLRFKAPEPPESWIHVRDGTIAGPMCTQKRLFLRHDHPTGTEDCLFLNVFTPQLSLSGSLPVMFWLHGGGWTSGDGSLYDPEFLLDHDVVLVTINYRLGPLGFLSTQDSASPGNYGLKDQVAALKWVKENIAFFGGDPDSVTVFGESAGGASAHYLMMSPLSQGLFHRAISQSGTALMPWALPTVNAAEKARKLGRLLGCPHNDSGELVDCLRKLDDYQIVSRDKDFMEWDIDPIIPFRPVVEPKARDSFLQIHPLLFKKGATVPWMTGVNLHEGLIRTAAIFANKTLVQDMQENFKSLLPISIQYYSSPNTSVITDALYKFYISSGELSIEPVTDIFSDGLFIWNADEAVRISKDSSPVYYYLFTYEGKYSFSDAFGNLNTTAGVCHADELLYLFPMKKIFPTAARPEEDIQVIHTMTDLWTNFARTGDPTPGNSLLKWPRVVSNDDLEYMEISNKLEIKKGLLKERMEFWRSLPLRPNLAVQHVKEEL